MIIELLQSNLQSHQSISLLQIWDKNFRLMQMVHCISNFVRKGDMLYDTGCNFTAEESKIRALFTLMNHFLLIKTIFFQSKLGPHTLQWMTKALSVWFCKRFLCLLIHFLLKQMHTLIKILKRDHPLYFIWISLLKFQATLHVMKNGCSLILIVYK